MTNRLVQYALFLLLATAAAMPAAAGKTPGLLIGSGSSTKAKAGDAVRQAVAQAEKQLHDNKVSFVIVTTSIGYDYLEILDWLQKPMVPTSRYGGLHHTRE